LAGFAALFSALPPRPKAASPDNLCSAVQIIGLLGLRQGDGLIGEDKTQLAQSEYIGGITRLIVLQSPVQAVIDASGSPYEISEEIPPVDGAGGAVLTATNAREPNANLVRPGMSIETAVTVLGRANFPPPSKAPPESAV
jgi:hypothetical protein